MSKILIISVCLGALLCLAGYSVFAIKDHRLTSWDIKLTKLATADSELASLAIVTKSDRKFLYYLAKPGTQRVIGVVDGRKDGKIVLNPRYPITSKEVLDYGPIPALTEFTFSDAVKIFGKTECKIDSPQEKECSYVLETVSPDNADSDKLKVNLELLFFADKLEKYRIKISGMPKSNWISVNQSS